jgi:excisionase family DNA binding protein
MAATKVDTELITTGEAARVLGTSRQHVVDLCKRGLLPFVTVGTHRRLHRADVDTHVRRDLTHEVARSLWLHTAVAGHLVRDPVSTMDKAGANLANLRRVHPTGMAARWLAMWQATCDAGVDAVLETLTSRSPRAIELRQNSPFAGVLSADERRGVLDAFRAYWRREHTLEA